ncbi:MAG: DUF502 domain-containing protein [Bacteroidia bacterium]
MKRIIGYFFKGLLVVLPIGITVLLFTKTIQWIDSIIYIQYPGLGLLAVLAAITLLGFLFSGIIGETMFHLLDEVMSRTPLVKIIYSSVKDLIEAFVGEKKKFNEPVLVKLSSSETEVIGFLTRKSLNQIGLEGKSAVYIPFSYTFTGQLMIVPNRNITPLHTNPTETMRFVVSAGVTGFGHDEDVKI